MTQPQPFITFYTPTYRRPKALAACLESVRTQTAVQDIEQIVLPDHIGLGVVDGLFGRIPLYADACRGQYVHILADDDVLASRTAVERVKMFAESESFPPVIIVLAQKDGHSTLPNGPLDPPQLGHIDLSCSILRADVWRQHANDYGRRYEGDFDHALALYNAGHRFAVCPLLFAIGTYSAGAHE